MRHLLIVFAICLFSAGQASAIAFGQIDTFDGGDAQNWISSFNMAPNPNPPTVVNDALLITGNGGVPPQCGPNPCGGRPTGFNAAQWAGDYSAAMVNEIQMDLSAGADNADALSLRILFGSFDAMFNPIGVYFSANPVVLNPGETLNDVSFSLALPDLTDLVALAAVGTSDYDATISSVLFLRIFDDPNGDGARVLGPNGFGTPPRLFDGTFAVDNITAIGPEPDPGSVIPEPGTALLVGAGLIALATRRRRLIS